MARTTLVLLPGLDGTGIMFRPLLAALGDSVPCQVVAYPGDRLLGYSELIPLVQKVLPRDRPFVLVGESFSGPLALMVAIDHPQGLQGVILCASFIRNPHPYIPRWCASLVRPVMLRFFPAMSQAKALLGGYSSATLRGLLREALAKVRPAVLAHRIRCVLRVDVESALKTCPVPILYIRGTRDVVVPKWNLARIEKTRPDIRAEHICSPHMVLQTHSDDAARVIREFLEQGEGLAGNH